MTRRRQIVWVAAILVVAALLVPAVAVAQPDSTSVTQGPNSALSWTNVRDSDGVPLSNYMFVTSDGNILNPLGTMLALVLQLMFAVWLVIITLAIWVIGFALSFGWLELFAEALLGTANLFAGQVATTIVLITAATLGAFFVSYFVVRGFYAKATMQVVTMLAVAVFGVMFLAHPLAEVLGPDGLLVKGRDLGVSIAAGLHGNSNPDPENVVATMQASLADNFARKPLQVWNFGHVIDDQCGSAWSSGMMAGDRNHAKSSLRACDGAAYAAAEEPSFTQFGAGLVLFVCGLILVWFAVRLGLKVIGAALNAVYHGFMSILGFAAGGYVYGPTQTFLIRNLVDTAFAAFGMAAYTVFLGIYVLVLGDVFRQARGQVITVLVLGAIVMLVASRQIDNLRASLESGGQWVANRFAMATQAFTGAGGGAGGGGQALGMGGGVGAPAPMSGLGTLATLTAMNTVATAAANPLVAWAWGNSKNPIVRPYRWQEGLSFQREFFGAMVQRHLRRRGWRRKGDPVTGRMLAGLVDDWFDNQYPVAFLGSEARSVAGIPQVDIDVALATKGWIEKYRPHDAAPAPSRAWTAWKNYVNRLGPDENGQPYDPRIVDASFEAAGVSIRNFYRNAGQYDTQPVTGKQREHLQTILDNMHSQEKLNNATGRDSASRREFWNNLEQNTRHTLAKRLAEEFRRAHHAYREDPTSENRDTVTGYADNLVRVHDSAKGVDARSPLQ